MAIARGGVSLLAWSLAERRLFRFFLFLSVCAPNDAMSASVRRLFMCVSVVDTNVATPPAVNVLVRH